MLWDLFKIVLAVLGVAVLIAGAHALFGVLSPRSARFKSRWNALGQAVASLVLLVVIGNLIGVPLGNDKAVAPSSPSYSRFGVLDAQILGSRMTSRTIWRHVSRSEFGAEWPLTVDEADVGCGPDLVQGFGVMLVVDDEPWALNGSTRGMAKGGRYHLQIGGRLAEVRVIDGPEPWWAPDGPDDMRKSIQPLFDVAKRMGCL